MDKGRLGLIEEEDEVAVEGGTEAEAEEAWEEAPLSCFRPTMAMQCGPGPPGCGTHADRAGTCVCVGERESVDVSACAVVGVGEAIEDGASQAVWER